MFKGAKKQRQGKTKRDNDSSGSNNPPRKRVIKINPTHFQRQLGRSFDSSNPPKSVDRIEMGGDNISAFLISYKNSSAKKLIIDKTSLASQEDKANLKELLLGYGKDASEMSIQLKENTAEERNNLQQQLTQIDRERQLSDDSPALFKNKQIQYVLSPMSIPPELIDTFVQDAEKDHPGIRWEKASKLKVWQSASSLTSIREALRSYQQDPSPDNLGILEQRINLLPDQSKRRYKGTLDKLKQSLHGISNPEAIGQLQGEPFARLYRVQDPPGTGPFTYFTPEKTTLGKDLSANKANFIKNVVDELLNIQTRTGIQIDDIPKLVESIVKDDKLGADSDQVQGTIWEDALRVLEGEVMNRVKTNTQSLKASGLIEQGSGLVGVAFTGSDFHKGGKQVLKLRFKNPDDSMKSIYYKPGNLQVDKLLYGKDGVAEKLGGISHYQIATFRDGRGDYGYMEAIEKGEPQTAADVLNMYKSLAANMAMSYYVGLEDVHHENIIMKKDSVQVIDMEATTGIFRANQNVHLGGFNDQLWGKAIWQGIREELKNPINKGTLQQIPSDQEIQKAMMDTFKKVIGRLKSKELKPSLEALERNLSQQQSRIVPISTNAFQKEIIPKVKEFDTYDAWKEFLEREAAQDEKGDKNIIKIGKGTTSSSDETIKVLLASRGVYDALRRGDVPFYTRDLGSSSVRDEAGNVIPIPIDNSTNQPEHPKVGQAIQVEMRNRRLNQPLNLDAIFQQQGVQRVIDLNTELRNILTTGSS